MSWSNRYSLSFAVQDLLVQLSGLGQMVSALLLNRARISEDVLVLPLKAFALRVPMTASLLNEMMSWPE